MWGSECPASQVTGPKAITVNTSSPDCVRAAKMLDSLIANKTMSTQDIFGPQFAKQQGSKILMMPGPDWYGGSVFQGLLKTPKGQIAVAPALHWANESTPVTGAVGGGAWWVSAHSTNLAAAVKFATWVTTSDAYQVDLAPGYPAYKAAAVKWVAKQQASGYWANNISHPDHRRGQPGLDRLDPAGVQPGIGLGLDGVRGHGPGQVDRVAAPGLADRHHQPGQGARLHGQQVTTGPVIADRAGRVAPATRPAPGPGPRRRIPVLATGHLFVSGYVVLLALFGVIPVIYSLYLALTRPTGGFAGLGNFIQTAEDYRFVPAVEHVAAFLVLWLVSLTVFVVLLALVVHRLASRRGKAFIRFAYYIPGALAGASSVLLWLFVLNPSVSPVSALLRWTGNTQFTSVIAPGPPAGGVHDHRVLDRRGRLDPDPVRRAEHDPRRPAGSGPGGRRRPLSTAWHVQLPLIGKWITYMLILSLAAGTQLFVEPQLVSQASFGLVSNYYSVNQLAYQYAFTQNNFNGAAAISIDLLIVALACAGILISRGRLFRTD